MNKKLHTAIYICCLILLVNLQLPAQIITPSTSNSNTTDSLSTDSTKADPDSIKEIIRRQDTTKKYSEEGVKVYSLKTIKTGELDYKILDTNPINFKDYYIAYNKNQYNLGAYGKASGALIPNFGGSSFKLKNDVFGIYNYKPKNILFYKTYGPYTLLSAIFNGSHEQIFKIIHTRNIKPNWNIGFNMKSAMGKGYYASNMTAATKNFNIDIWNWYQSPNAKYNLYSALIINKHIVPESGGIVDNGALIDPETEPNFYTVYLTNARNERKNVHLFINQSYSFVSKASKISPDAINEKAAIAPKQAFVIPKIEYNFSYVTDKYLYIDRNNKPSVNQNFYNQYLVNTKFTEDNISASTFENQINLKIRTDRSKLLSGDVQFGVTHTITNYIQTSKDVENLLIPLIDTTLNSLSINGQAKINLNGYIDLAIKPTYVIYGYNNKDSQIKLSAQVPKLAPKLLLTYSTQAYEPDFTLQHYKSNHHSWDNSFGKVYVHNLNISYKNPKILNVSLQGFLIHNFVYLKQVNVNILPVQNTDIHKLLQLNINREFDLGRYVKLNSALILQKIPEDILFLPQLFTRNSIYYHNTFFTNLYLATGIDFSYFKLDKLYSYSPELSLFYMSEQRSNPNAFVLTTDLFISGNVGNASFFAKYALVNEALKYPQRFYTVNNYIMPYPSLSLGVSWRFYD